MAATAQQQQQQQQQGLDTYYKQKIEALEVQIRDKQLNLRRQEAQCVMILRWTVATLPISVGRRSPVVGRVFSPAFSHPRIPPACLTRMSHPLCRRNELNSKVRLLREELQRLQEPGSYVGEVVKLMGKKKALVKVNPEGKYVVDIEDSIDTSLLKAGARVALRNDSYALHYVLPTKVDPLVSLMKVEKVPDSTYDMVGGLDQQIKEIKEVIELPLKHPELFDALGIAQPKGVLLYGPPGTGKTLLARAVAHHTDCTFIRVSGGELVQKYIGEGSRMVRELFVMAREHAPSIIFMDEVDSIGSARMEGGGGGGDSEVQRTMLELLNQLDGFEATQSIKVLMATNRIDILDAALLRPGRIDRKIEFPNPNEESRLEILKIHSRKMNLMRGSV